jgi:hypothetical protein
LFVVIEKGNVGGKLSITHAVSTRQRKLIEGG